MDSPAGITGPFQSAPPVKGATANYTGWPLSEMFQSAPPVKGATPPARPTAYRVRFNPRPP